MGSVNHQEKQLHAQHFLCMSEMATALSCRLHIPELFSATVAFKTEWRVKQGLQKGELDHAHSSVDLAFENNLLNGMEKMRARRDIILSILMLSECTASGV